MRRDGITRAGEPRPDPAPPCCRHPRDSVLGSGCHNQVTLPTRIFSGNVCNNFGSHPTSPLTLTPPGHVAKCLRCGPFRWRRVRTDQRRAPLRRPRRRRATAAWMFRGRAPPGPAGRQPHRRGRAPRSPPPAAADVGPAAAIGRSTCNRHARGGRLKPKLNRLGFEMNRLVSSRGECFENHSSRHFDLGSVAYSK